ncbi:hypothetical protein [Pseudomonas sp. CCOS 191]|uniref:hypothetical protein n=1 Tax=Pseudomonas sp. CCOS 191 TaxID=1649877 RepID=UPI0018E6818F|nr:hypothetical protein [Pseudomonas sp. CCOS 191]MBI6951651.1 hypothetical protein [Pseudomonas sp. CCOS 191]
MKGAKDYCGLSLHSNEDIMMADDPLLSKLQGIDMDVSLVPGVADFLALGVPGPSNKLSIAV